MQIYESLDISIHDLEREKHQLSVESSHSKKQIKEWVKFWWFLHYFSREDLFNKYLIFHPFVLFFNYYFFWKFNKLKVAKSKISYF
jgi:hypothetical protein